MRNRKYRKKRKRGRGKPYIRKNKDYFWRRRPYLKKKKFISVRVEKEIKEGTVYLEQFFRQHYL